MKWGWQLVCGGFQLKSLAYIHPRQGSCSKQVVGMIIGGGFLGMHLNGKKAQALRFGLGWGIGGGVMPLGALASSQE